MHTVCLWRVSPGNWIPACREHSAAASAPADRRTSTCRGTRPDRRRDTCRHARDTADQGPILRRSIPVPDRYLRRPLGKPPRRPVRMDSRDPRSLAQGHVPVGGVLPATDRGRRRTASARQTPHRPVPAGRRRHLLVDRCRLRQRHRHAGCIGVPESRPRQGHSGRARSIPVRSGRPRMDLLRPSHTRGVGPAHRHSLARRGNRVAWPREPVQLRPAVPVSGHPHWTRGRQPHCRAAGRSPPPAWHHRVPGPRNPRTVRRPVGVPVQHPAAVCETCRCAGHLAAATQTRPRRAPPAHADLVEDHAQTSGGRASVVRCPHPVDGHRFGSGDDFRGQARGVHREPGVLRPPAHTPKHLGHTTIPAQLRRNTRRRPDPASWTAAAADHTDRIRRQCSAHRRHPHRRHIPHVHLLGRTSPGTRHCAPSTPQTPRSGRNGPAR